MGEESCDGQEGHFCEKGQGPETWGIQLEEKNSWNLEIIGQNDKNE